MCLSACVVRVPRVRASCACVGRGAAVRPLRPPTPPAAEEASGTPPAARSPWSSAQPRGGETEAQALRAGETWGGRRVPARFLRSFSSDVVLWNRRFSQFWAFRLLSEIVSYRPKFAS